MRNHLVSLAFLLANSASPSIDTIRGALEATSEKWFRLLLISSGVVAFGCILEVGETWTNLKRWLRLRRDFPVGEENPRSWLIPIGAIGLFLVILGVVGEGVFEDLASNADTALRAHDSQMLAQALHEAGNAKDSATAAADAAVRANAAADTAEGEAISAEGKATTASDKTDLEIKKREQLGTEVGWRKLTPEQRKKIGRACKGTTADTVSVSSYGMDTEAKALAVQIAQAISNHTFSVNFDSGGIVTSAALDEGVLISAPPEKTAFANCLATALSTLGHLKNVEVNGKMHRDGAVIGGAAEMSGAASISGGGGEPTVVIPPRGSPISIFIGEKPVEPMPQKH